MRNYVKRNIYEELASTWTKSENLGKKYKKITVCNSCYDMYDKSLKHEDWLLWWTDSDFKSVKVHKQPNMIDSFSEIK
jgi:hypothetical protein